MALLKYSHLLFETNSDLDNVFDSRRVANSFRNARIDSHLSKFIYVLILHTRGA